MFIKKANTSMKIEALNNPNWEYIRVPKRVKEAASNLDKVDLNGFDIKTAISENPDNLFVKIFAIKANEINDNGDLWTTAELKEAASSFIGVPMFCNHQNNDIEKARGTCVHAWFDEKEDGIFIVSRIDKVMYPKLARGIESGIVVATSMGTTVEYTVCSVCHKCAKTAKDYCQHIANRKNRKFSGEIECQFHKSDYIPTEKCPICGSSKSDSKVLKHSETQIYEYNYGSKFIEDSFVVNPACHDCLVSEILHIPEVNKKIAELKECVTKLSSIEYDEKLQKVAGKTELVMLSEAMDTIEKVAKSILAQKNQIDVQYVQDLIEAIVKIQETQDDLTKQGYGQLPSPQGVYDNLNTGSDNEKVVDDMVERAESPQPAPTGRPYTPQATSLNDLGTVTLPTTASNKNNEIKDFIYNNDNIEDSLQKLSQIEHSLKDNNKEFNGTMSDKNQKTAGIGKNLDKTTDVNQITEGQLNENSLEQNKRKESPDQITQVQLDTPSLVNNQTSTESPTTRLGSYETITEDQMQSFVGNDIIRVADAPDVITEKQWTPLSQSVKANLSADWTDSITESQLKDLLSHHVFVNDNSIYDVITEGQLKLQPFGNKRWANKNYVDAVVKAATGSIVDVITNYHKTPNDILNTIHLINDDDKVRNKAAFVTVINALPEKLDSREKFASNQRYWQKIASDSKVANIDALSLSISDNAVSGISAKDVFDTIEQIIVDKKAMSSIDEMVQNKINDKSDDTVIGKMDAIKSAISELATKSDDGRYKISAVIDEIGADVTDKKAFVAAAKKLAQETIGTKSPVLILKIDLNDEKGVVDIEAITEDQADPDMLDADMDFMSIDNDVPESECGCPLTDIVEKIENNDSDVAEVEVVDLGDDSEEDDEVVEDNDDENEEDVEDNTEENNDDDEEEIYFENRASKREDLVKKAQFGAPAGMGGAPAGDMPGAGAPGMNTGMGLESVQTNGAPEDLGFEDDLEDATAQPPGTICPVCGSKDVDTIRGRGKCNNCGSEFQTKIDIEVTRWAGLTGEDKSDEDGLADDLAETDEEGAGFEVGGDLRGSASAGPISFAVVTKIVPETIEKVASIIEQVKELQSKGESLSSLSETTGIRQSTLSKLAKRDYFVGSISPATGTADTVKLASGEYKCLDTGTSYKVEVAVNENNPKEIYAQWVWKPEQSFIDCEECHRKKANFTKALKEAGYSVSDFRKLQGSEENIKKASKIILDIKKAGLLKEIKTASLENDIIKAYKEAAGYNGEWSFPTEEFRELLARRYGLDAIALSGPCEGKKLVECIPAAMKAAGFYSHDVAMKMASVWSNTDGCTDCVEHQIRLGLNLKQASSVCDALKDIYASDEEILVNKIAQIYEDTDEYPDPDTDPDGGKTVDVVEDVDDDFDDNVFGDLANNDVVDSIVSLIDATGVTEEVDAKLDEKLGEDPATEEHHQDETVGDVIDNADDVIEDVDIDIEVEDVNPMEEDINETAQYVEGEENLENNKGDLLDNVEVDDMNREAQYMHSSFSRVGQTTLDLSSVAEAIGLTKKTSQSKEVKQKNVQKVEAIQPIQDGKTIGNEEKFDAKTPDVPAGDERIGGEKKNKDIKPNVKQLPKVPSGDSNMGHEKEEGYTAEKEVTLTGGSEGAGTGEYNKAASDARSDRLRHFSDSVMDSLRKSAENIKQKDVKKPEAVSKDKDIQPIQDGKTLGKEEKFDAKEVGKVKDGKTMGNEDEIIGGMPKEDLKIPADNQLMGGEKKNKNIKPEKQTNIKGTVIASGDSESEYRRQEATRVVAKMLTEGIVKSAEVFDKIKEFEKYDVTQIRDIEKSMFNVKGFNTAQSGGLEQPLIIDENRSTMDVQKDLTSKIASMFTLGQQVKDADNLPGSAQRRAFRR